MELKKRILSTSLILGLLFQPLHSVQANDEISEEVVTDEVENTTVSEDLDKDTEKISIAPEVKKELWDKLETLLDEEYQTVIESLFTKDSVKELFVEAIYSHEEENFVEASSAYDHLLNNVELSVEEFELLKGFKDLADNKTILSDSLTPEKRNEESGTDNSVENESMQASTALSSQPAEEVEESDDLETELEDNSNDNETTAIEVVSQTEVNYRGYLTSTGAIFDLPGGEVISNLNDLTGNEVNILIEASASDNSIWKYIQVMGTNISGWVAADGVVEEQITTTKDVSYRGYLNRSTDTINTRPWGTKGYREIRRVEGLRGREVEILQEATTQRATWLYVNIRGTNISGWIDKAGVTAETISNSKDVNYRGYLARKTDTINTQPWGTPGFKEIRHVEDLVGREVEVLKEATTQRASWLYVNVRGTNVSGWIDKAGVNAESISSQTNIQYRGTLTRATDTLNTLPWGTPGFKEIRHVEDLVGREVEVQREATTQRATWLYVHVRGTNINGWVDKAGVRAESITNQKNVNYRGYLARRTDTINTLPWGVRGFKEIRHVTNLQGREVKVTKEAVTPRATWLYVEVVGANVSGWVDKAGVTPERISSQKNVNYQAYLSRSSDTINTQPWGTIGNRVIRRVNDLTNRKVNVTREAKTQRATWAFITVPGTNISGWVDKAGLRDNILIYLDPGHGGGNRNGGNPGAVYNGVREQDLNLNISLQVRDRLEKLGYQVVMSRENDNNSYHNNWREDLYARPAHANKIGADILVSIHHNASGIWDSSMNGIETYVYGVNPEYPPLPENKNSHNNPQRMNESRKLANAVHKELISNTGARDRGVQSGAFIVVREAKMPAVLLELGFMSNRAELNRLTTTSYQQKLVNGIVTGIHNYFLI